MTKNISYRILPELNLVIEYYFGSFGANDYIELKIAQLNDSLFNPMYNNIADIRNSKLSISNDDIKKCIDYMKSAKGLVGKRRAAVLTATPDQVVFSTLFARYGIELPMQYEIVSTIGAAIGWVNLAPSDHVIVEDILRELKEGVKVN